MISQISSQLQKFIAFEIFSLFWYQPNCEITQKRWIITQFTVFFFKSIISDTYSKLYTIKRLYSFSKFKKNFFTLLLDFIENLPRRSHKLTPTAGYPQRDIITSKLGSCEISAHVIVTNRKFIWWTNFEGVYNIQRKSVFRW